MADVEQLETLLDACDEMLDHYCEAADGEDDAAATMRASRRELEERLRSAERSPDRSHAS